MNCPLWGLAFTFLVLAGDGFPSHGQDTALPQAPVSAPQLVPLFSDHFSSDSLSDFNVQGNVAWNKGRISLPQQSTLGRSFKACSWLEVTAGLEFPTLTDDGQQSLTLLQIDLKTSTTSQSESTTVYAAWQQTRTDGRIVSRIAILKLILKNKAPSLQAIRVVELPRPLKAGAWSVSYRFGLLEIHRDEQPVLAGYFDNGSAAAINLAWTQQMLGVHLRHLKVQRGLSLRPLSETDQQTMAEATQHNTQFVKLVEQGRYAEAKELGESILAARQRVLGQSHPDYATSLNNMGAVYRSQGDYVKARSLLLQALEIRRRALGEMHPSYANTLSNLAMVYSLQGNYADAEPLYLQVQDIRRRAMGDQHPMYLSNLNSLAALHYRQGNFGKAEPLYLQALKGRREVLGELHPHYANSLNNLAALYTAQQSYARAAPLYRQALEIRKRVQGESHPEYAISLNNLGIVYNLQDDYVKAEALFLQALKIHERVLGKSHSSYAVCLHNLAWIYKSQRAYEKAEALLQKSVNIFRSLPGASDPDYPNSLNNLAVLYELQLDHSKAAPLIREALDVSRRLITQNAMGQSQVEQIRYAAVLRSHLDHWLSHSLTVPAVPDRLFDDILAWKGMTLVRQRRYRLLSDNDQTAPLLNSLLSITRQLSAQLRQSPATKTSNAWHTHLSTLSEQRDALESRLAAVSRDFRKSRQRLRTEDLLSILPADTVLIDYLSFTFRERIPQGDHHVMKHRQYVLASILRKGHPVQFVNLGPEADINAAIDRWRTALLSNQTEAAAQVEPEGRKLRRLIWEPLLPHLKRAGTVLLCPDAALGQVAFAALPGRKPGTFLIEDHRLACIPVPQLLPDLLERVTTDSRPEGDLLLLGDVDYSAVSEHASESETKKQRRRGSEELFRDVAFGPLDETAGELATIRDLFFELYDAQPEAVRTLRKQQASEAAFRRYAGQYETLHLATHGFFADPSKKSITQSASDEPSGTRSGLFGQNDSALSHVRGFHPGMLSGLALAGANVAPESQDTDDGILTADEISFQRLKGVELVVLSACETGLGQTAGGEGLLGVQRAFQVAGARSVVASLWNVDDVATRRLMDRFYRNLWDKEMTRLDALREAQRWMLTNPASIRGSIVRLKKPTSDKPPGSASPAQRTHPRFWAAFVLSGDWR